MKKIRKKTNRVVNELYDTDVEFVSLVGRGANQTPFKVVKLLDICNTESSTSSKDVHIDAMHKTSDNENKLIITKEEYLKSSGADVQSMVFMKKQFPSIKSVESYLSSKSYVDFNVVEHNDGYSVEARAESDFKDGLVEIDTKKGVIMVVGELKEAELAGKSEEIVEPTNTPEETVAEVEVQEVVKEDTVEAEEAKTEEVQEVAKEAEEVSEQPENELAGIATKYDSFSALFSAGTSISDVMKDGYDGFPPAFPEVTDAFIVALRNNLLNNDTQAIKSLVKEYGNLVIKLDDMFNALKGIEGSDLLAAKLLGENPVIEQTEKAVSEDAVESVKAEEAQPDSGEVESIKEETPVEEVSKEVDLATLITESLAKALVPALEKLGETVAKTNETLEGTKSEVQILKDTISESEKRVKELECLVQTRKSGSELEDGIKSSNRTAYDANEELKARNRVIKQVYFN